MINYNTTGSSLKRGIVNFSKKIGEKLTKPTQKFVADMIYGIIASKSSKLTEIGKELKEKTALKKVTERLGRNLKNFCEGETVSKNYLEAI